MIRTPRELMATAAENMREAEIAYPNGDLVVKFLTAARDDLNRFLAMDPDAPAARALLGGEEKRDG